MWNKERYECQLYKDVPVFDKGTFFEDYAHMNSDELFIELCASD